MARKFVLRILLVLTLYFPVQITAQQQTQERKIVRVLTFNILHGATTKGDFNLDLLADVINNADPDFVALQEVDFKTKRARNLDLTTELADRKSTRLNSSHVKISYAVFCLKKKTYTKIDNRLHDAKQAHTT